jgi:hypothetical protein
MNWWEAGFPLGYLLLRGRSWRSNNSSHDYTVCIPFVKTHVREYEPGIATRSFFKIPRVRVSNNCHEKTLSKFIKNTTVSTRTMMRLGALLTTKDGSDLGILVNLLKPINQNTTEEDN